MPFDSKLSDFIQASGSILLGKEHEIRLAVSCLLARGHLLIEDIPGVGKTTLVQVLAKGLGLGHVRIQFTSDLLPADIIGTSVFDPRTASFSLHRGPVFSHFVLADELNRASPKTQSALLQAMEERVVSIDNESLTLPDPFFVFATQNPREQAGTFALPESQIDRFMMCLSLGYPDPNFEMRLLEGVDRRQMIEKMPSFYHADSVLELQRNTAAVHVSRPIIEYIEALLIESRRPRSDETAYGLSPRAGMALVNAARAWCFLEGRQAVIPEDVQIVVPYVFAHRLASREKTADYGQKRTQEILHAVAVP